MGPQSSGLVIGIDTGRNMGWGWGINDTLMGCGLWDLIPSEPIKIRIGFGLPGLPPGKAIVEIPEDRPGNLKGTVNDLLRLGMRAGRAIEWALFNGHHVREIKASEYRGGISKEMYNKRTLKRLTPPERELVDAAFQQIPKGRHNDVLDGVALFLLEVGRDPNRGIQ